MTAFADGPEFLHALLVDYLYKVGIVVLIALLALVAMVIIYRSFGSK